MGSEVPPPVTIYITGFKKFHGVAENPTETIVANLGDYMKKRGMPNGMILGSCTILDTAGQGALVPLYQTLKTAVSRDDTNSSNSGRIVWVHFGVNSGATKFAIEKQAFNEATFRCPDEMAWKPQKVSIIPADGGLSRIRETSLPVDDITKALAKAGFEVVTSQDASAGDSLHSTMATKTFLFFLALLFFSSLSVFAENEEADPGLVMNFYKDSCPQAEDIIKEQVKLLYKRHKNTAFSWLRNIFHDCFVESCDASLLLDSTRRILSEKEHDRSFGMRNFRYIEEIKEAVERECPGVVSCADILVLSGRDGIQALGGPHIPLKTGRRDGRKIRTDILEQYLPDHNESMSVVLERFSKVGIDTPGVVALLGSHSVGRTHCVKLVHRLYPEVDPQLNPGHVEHMLKKCPDPLPDPKAVQYVRNDRGTPMVLDNNYYRNILDNKGLMLVDHQLATDKKTKPYVKKMAKSQDYFFQEYARAITILTENNPLTGTKGEIRKQCNVANKLH